MALAVSTTPPLFLGLTTVSPTPSTHFRAIDRDVIYQLCDFLKSTANFKNHQPILEKFTQHYVEAKPRSYKESKLLVRELFRVAVYVCASDQFFPPASDKSNFSYSRFILALDHAEEKQNPMALVESSETLMMQALKNKFPNYMELLSIPDAETYNLSQHTFNRNALKFLKDLHQARSIGIYPLDADLVFSEMTGGMCFGFSVAFALARRSGEIEAFLKCQEDICNWDRAFDGLTAAECKSWFAHICRIVSCQNPEFDLRQRPLDQDTVISPRHAQISELKEIKSRIYIGEPESGAILTPPIINNILTSKLATRCFKEGFIIGTIRCEDGFFHAVTIHAEGEEWMLFDSNLPSGPKYFNSLPELIIKLLDDLKKKSMGGPGSGFIGFDFVNFENEFSLEEIMGAMAQYNPKRLISDLDKYLQYLQACGKDLESLKAQALALLMQKDPLNPAKPPLLFSVDLRDYPRVFAGVGEKILREISSHPSADPYPSTLASAFLENPRKRKAEASAQETHKRAREH